MWTLTHGLATGVLTRSSSTRSLQRNSGSSSPFFGPGPFEGYESPAKVFDHHGDLDNTPAQRLLAYVLLA
jgi:hypothetical protein